jgi:hypothetical protein
VVTKLVEPLHNSGRNITCDNFFTSVKLADMLLSQGLTLLGTMRRNIRDIPQEFQSNRARPVGSSVFGFDDTKTLVSYVPAKNRSAILLSSMHNDNKLDDSSKKPDMIVDYNRTKGGVDSIDQLCHKYTVKRSTRRWPMCIFYGILDIIGINSMIVFLHNNSNFLPKTSYKRRIILENLAMELIKPQLEFRRSNASGLHKSTRAAMSAIGYPCLLPEKAPRSLSTRSASRKRKRCFYCPSKIDRKVFTECDACGNRACPEHSTTITSIKCYKCI